METKGDPSRGWPQLYYLYIRSVAASNDEQINSCGEVRLRITGILYVKTNEVKRERGKMFIKNDLPLVLLLPLLSSRVSPITQARTYQKVKMVAHIWIFASIF